jgi:hypothetical protein
MSTPIDPVPAVAAILPERVPIMQRILDKQEVAAPTRYSSSTSARRRAGSYSSSAQGRSGSMPGSRAISRPTMRVCTKPSQHISTDRSGNFVAL